MTMLVIVAVWRFLLGDELRAAAGMVGGTPAETASSLCAILSRPTPSQYVH
jgi:hypothetical protein